MPRWLSRTLTGVASFIVALCAAAVAFLTFVPTIDLAAIPGDLVGYLSGDPLGKMGTYFLATVGQFAKFAAPFALIAAVLGEMKSYRSWWYYTVCGTGLALLGYLIWQESRTASAAAPDEMNLLVYAAYAVAGAIGGLVYWYLAGRNAGSASFLGTRPGSTYKSASGPAKSSTPGKSSTDRDTKNKSAAAKS